LIAAGQKSAGTHVDQGNGQRSAETSAENTAVIEAAAR